MKSICFSVRLVLFILLLMLAALSNNFSQELEEDVFLEITQKNGTKISGFIKSQNDSEIEVLGQDLKMHIIKKSEIYEYKFLENNLYGRTIRLLNGNKEIVEYEKPKAALDNNDENTEKEKTDSAQIAALEKGVNEISSDMANNPIGYKRIIFKDETDVIGKIISSDSSNLQIKTMLDITMTIPKSSIKSIEKIKGEFKEGKYRRFDPNRTRLFFAPTGRALEAGEGYFSISELFFPMLAIGVTDWMSLAGGFLIFPGSIAEMYYANIKITPYSSDDYNISIGGLITGLKSEDFYTGILYISNTIGDNSNSLTFGAGIPYIDGEITEYPILLLGGEVRISNSLKLMSENWFIIDKGSDSINLLSLGIRFFGENLAADFGFITNSELLGSDVSFPFIPWVGFSYNFGGN